jgi:hypothetical protein
MKMTLLLFLLFSDIGLSLAQDGDPSQNHGETILEQEIGYENNEGIFEVAHIETGHTESSLFILPGSIYLASHLGEFDGMSYDRFSSYLLNIMNHHAKAYGALKLETGIKIFGFEHQPFGAEPGSALRFLRLNFTEIEIIGTTHLNDSDDIQIHFILSGKLGKSRQNEDMATLNREQMNELNTSIDCEQCILDAMERSWGNHQSAELAIEFEMNKMLIKTYAGFNRDTSSSPIIASSYPTSTLNYQMMERKFGVEAEYEVYGNNYGSSVRLFTSLEYYMLNQDILSGEYMAPNINNEGLLFKVGVKINTGNNSRRRRKKKKKYDL